MEGLKIPRVCRSVKTAETSALGDGLYEAIHTARIMSEIYSGEIDLKKPNQIPVSAKTDSKSLWESLHNSRQCEEKLLRNTIAGIKELAEFTLRFRSRVQSVNQLTQGLGNHVLGSLSGCFKRNLSLN